MRYERHDKLVAPARRHPALWRLAVGLCVVASVQFAVLMALLYVITVFSDPSRVDARLADMMAPSAPLTTLLTLASFGGLILGVWLAARLMQRRSLGSVIGPGATSLRHFAISAGMTLAVLGIMLALWRLAYAPDPGLPPGRWLALLTVSLLAILIQTGAEEIAFRGYLQSQLAARFASPLVWMAVPALAFGALHFAPAQMGWTGAGVAAGAATLFGLLAADLTARTGTLGAAWGFHFANNVSAILIVSTPGSISGLALWLTPYDIADGPSAVALAVDLAAVVLVWALIRRALRV